MSVLRIGGVRMAAGLEWERGLVVGSAARRIARQRRRPLAVDVVGQTGFLDEAEGAESTKPLAGVLATLLQKRSEAEDWVAFVEEDADAEAERRLAVIRFRLTGPSRTGAPALHVAMDAGGRLEQMLVNSVGPIELWALNTAPRDVALRNRVQARLGAAAGRAALAAMFPSGSARDRVDAEVRALEGRGMEASVEEAEILDGLAEETVRRAARAAA